MSDTMRQVAKSKLEQRNSTTVTQPLQILIDNLELLQQLEPKLKPIQTLVEAVRNLTPEGQLQPQLENHQSQIQSQLENLYQHIFSLQQQNETTTPQMNLILEELQESLPMSQQILKELKAAIATLQTANTALNQELSEIKAQSQQAIKQSAIQSRQQQKQVKQLTEVVNQLRQPIPIKPGWVKICSFLTMYAISTACTVVLMLRYLPPQISQPLPPTQSNPHK